MSPSRAREVLAACAQELGLALVGVTSAARFRSGERAARERLGQGLMGALPWYTEERIRRGTRPRELLPGARSIVAVAMAYLPQPMERDAPLGPLHGRVGPLRLGPRLP